VTASSHPVVSAYVEAVNARDVDTIVGLFAPGATLSHPLGTFTGAREIGTFYRDVVIAGQADVTAGAVLSEGTLVMAEISATSALDPNASTAHAIDVFRLDEQGLVADLEIYYR
jgi:steroid delta-isomerase